MRKGSARVGLEWGLSPEGKTFMRATSVEPVAQVRAKICVTVIVLRLPRTAPQFACDWGTVNT
jgi:hypothetical protein